MKMVEIGYRSKLKELEKLNARLQRAERALEKKRTTATKLGVCDWSDEEHREWLNGVETTKEGWIISKADAKKNGAWFDLKFAESNVEDVQREIEMAEKRFEKIQIELDAYYEELAEMDVLKAKEAYQREFEAEQKEWAKDGITLERRYEGITPQGKKFWIERNRGWTKRSRHCFSLYIEGTGIIFTSGEFWRAYSVIKER